MSVHFAAPNAADAVKPIVKMSYPGKPMRSQADGAGLIEARDEQYDFSKKERTHPTGSYRIKYRQRCFSDCINLFRNLNERSPVIPVSIMRPTRREVGVSLLELISAIRRVQLPRRRKVLRPWKTSRLACHPLHLLPGRHRHPVIVGIQRIGGVRAGRVRRKERPPVIPRQLRWQRGLR